MPCQNLSPLTPLVKEAHDAVIPLGPVQVAEFGGQSGQAVPSLDLKYLALLFEK